MEEIVSMISTVGFPIAAAVAIFMQYKKITETITIAMNENTRVLTRLVERLGFDETNTE